MQPSNREIAAAVVLVVAVLLACNSGSKAQVTPAGEAPPIQAAAAAPAPSPTKQVQPAKLGDTVTFADSTWVVTKADKLGSTVKSNNQFQHDLKSEGGVFVRVVFKITNLGKAEERLLSPPKLMDSQGREFNEVDELVFYIPEGKKTLMMEAIPPSLPKEFWSIYEVPNDASGLRFMARELATAGSTYPVDLALK